MAISKNISFQPAGLATTIEVESAYHKITRFAGDKNCVEFTLGVFQSKIAKTPFMNKAYFFSPLMTDSNIVAQCYNHLKTLPEFLAATDC